MKLRKGRIALALAMISFITASAYKFVTYEPYVTYTEYHKEVASGETVWGICSKIATDKDDIQKLVYNTMKINNIKDPNQVREGMMLIIRVKTTHGLFGGRKNEVYEGNKFNEKKNAD